MLGMQTHDDLVAIQGNPPYQGCPALDVAQTGFTCEACCWFFSLSRSPWFLPLPFASPLVSFPPALPRAWRPRCDSCLGLQRCCDCLGVGPGEPSPWNPQSPQCSPGGTSCPIWSHSQLHRYRLELGEGRNLLRAPTCWPYQQENTLFQIRDSLQGRSKWGIGDTGQGILKSSPCSLNSEKTQVSWRPETSSLVSKVLVPLLKAPQAPHVALCSHLLTGSPSSMITSRGAPLAEIWPIGQALFLSQGWEDGVLSFYYIPSPSLLPPTLSSLPLFSSFILLPPFPFLSLFLSLSPLKISLTMWSFPVRGNQSLLVFTLPLTLGEISGRDSPVLGHCFPIYKVKGLHSSGLCLLTQMQHKTSSGAGHVKSVKHPSKGFNWRD